jgi:eukaryotic-like serine/threonine-protein kinase
MKSNVSEFHEGQTPRRRIGIIVAILFIMLLVISLVIALNLVRQSRTAVGSHSLVSASQLGVYVGSGDGILYKLDAKSGSLIWHQQIDGSHMPAPPAVADGVVYYGSRDGSIHARNSATGSQLWSYQTGSSVLSSPVVVNGTVYVGSSNNYLYALNAKSGKQLWRYNAETGTGAAPTASAVDVGTAVVVNGVVYGRASDDVNHSYLFALDAANGAQVWRSQINNQIFSNLQVDNGEVYIASSAITQQGGPSTTDSYAYAFNVNNGTQTWRSAKISDMISGAPAVANGMVYVGSRDTNVYALDAKTGSSLWHYHAGGSIYSSPQVINGVLYAGVASSVSTVTNNRTNTAVDSTSTSGSIIALDATTGSLRWQHPLDKYIGSPLTVIENVVYVGTNNNFVYALSATGGSQVWSYQIASSVPFSNAPITVAP